MERTPEIVRIQRPDRILSYLRPELWSLGLMTVTGIAYNIGMTAGPYFEGLLAGCLLEVLQGRKGPGDMLRLAGVYLAVILLVQVARCIKRYSGRHLANGANRNMRHMLYNSLVHLDRNRLEQEGMGAVMTKAVADVDACTEGIRKFITEVFDTGVVLVAYLAMLLVYDWRLTLLAGMFTPIAYLIAGKLGGRVTRYNAAYKTSAGQLNAATMDRISGAVTYRVYGRENARDTAYEGNLADYEQRAVWANLWENTMQPLYHIISMCGVVSILYFGARNVLGTGWTSWDIAAFTTFLSCFTKMAVKSSKAAKLFNAVQKAQVSWARIRPLMREYIPTEELTGTKPAPAELRMEEVSVSWPDQPPVLEHITFAAHPGQIIGITGPVACGKSTLGKALIGESRYQGSIRIGGRELRELSSRERSRSVTYMGHHPELMSVTIRENILLGGDGDAARYLQAVCLDQEVAEMPQGMDTPAGDAGTRLSGGQQARVALARTLCHAGQVLVLDDPFSAVDRATEQEILEHLRRLAEDRVVLIFSHRLYQFPNLDGVLFLDQGTGRFSTHSQLMRDCPAYAELYRIQTEGENR